MPYYKDQTNNLHFLSDTDITNGGEKLLPAGCSGITDVAANKIIAAQQAVAAQQPNIAGFATALKEALSGIVASNKLAAAYPLLLPAINSSSWSDIKDLISDANSNSLITQGQYAAIKIAITANNIPVLLP